MFSFPRLGVPSRAVVRWGVVGLLTGGLALPSAAAQTTATLTGQVTDSQGGGLVGAHVSLTQPVTGVELLAVTGPDATYRLANIPPQTYRLTVGLSGFDTVERDVDLRTNVPVRVDVALDVASQADTIVVSAREPGRLVDPTATGTRAAIGQGVIQRMPSATGSRGLEAVIVSFPGFAQNANGAIHPRGAHNQMTFVVDGLPISDQLTGAFANALDTSMVEAVELMTGNIPAEFGAKISGVAVVTTRSGVGLGRGFSGDTSVRGGQFGTAQSATRLGGERGRVGYFAAVTGMRTDRFLDQVSVDNLHNEGAFWRAFGRVDSRLGERDVLRAYGMGGRSAFELANLRSQQAAGQDQRQTLADWSTWATHLRTIGDRATLESTAAFRTSTSRLWPSAGDTPVTAAQQRRLSTITLATRYSRVSGRHMLRAGVDVQRFPVRERFTLGLTSPDLNDPASRGFNPGLAAHDLTRGGSLFRFEAARTGTLASGFVQDQIHLGRLTATLGLRVDEYRFLVEGRQWQPRIGVAWSPVDARTVLRASYNRTYQTPPNENLLLSGSVAASRLAPESVRRALGDTHAPIRPERQHVFEAGLQQAIAGRASLDLAVYHKRARDQQDNNNFFDTGIIFPTTLEALEASGLEARLTIPTMRGVSGAVSATASRAVSTPPFTGGLFLGQDAVDLLSEGPFRIDHDQALSLHGTVSYATPFGPWFGASVRYDSGLVANPSDPEAVRSDPDFFDLLPYVDLTAEIPRVRPRTVIDLVAGYDARRGGRRLWSLRAQLNNVTNRTALFNFQSVFVGTRLVQPRTASLEFGYHW
jgi:hypothetical protein